MSIKKLPKLGEGTRERKPSKYGDGGREVGGNARRANLKRFSLPKAGTVKPPVTFVDEDIDDLPEPGGHPEALAAKAEEQGKHLPNQSPFARLRAMSNTLGKGEELSEDLLKSSLDQTQHGTTVSPDLLDSLFSPTREIPRPTRTREESIQQLKKMRTRIPILRKTTRIIEAKENDHEEDGAVADRTGTMGATDASGAGPGTGDAAEGGNALEAEALASGADRIRGSGGEDFGESESGGLDATDEEGIRGSIGTGASTDMDVLATSNAQRGTSGVHNDTYVDGKRHLPMLNQGGMSMHTHADMGGAAIPNGGMANRGKVQKQLALIGFEDLVSYTEETDTQSHAHPNRGIVKSNPEGMADGSAYTHPVPSDMQPKLDQSIHLAGSSNVNDIKDLAKVSNAQEDEGKVTPYNERQEYDAGMLMGGLPGIACNGCSAAEQCPEFRENSTCAFDEHFSGLSSRDMLNLIPRLEVIADMQFRRGMHAAYVERRKTGGQLMPEVTRQLEIAAIAAERVARLKSPQQKSGSSPLVVVNQNAGSQGGGLISRLMAGVTGQLPQQTGDIVVNSPTEVIDVDSVPYTRQPVVEEIEPSPKAKRPPHSGNAF